MKRWREDCASALAQTVGLLAPLVLTPRQHEAVRLYFFEGLNQREIAGRLGIAQQSVSEHLYGKVRDGHAVGGALRKLRRACAERGIVLSAWL